MLDDLQQYVNYTITIAATTVAIGANSTEIVVETLQEGIVIYIDRSCFNQINARTEHVKKLKIFLLSKSFLEYIVNITLFNNL